MPSLAMSDSVYGTSSGIAVPFSEACNAPCQSAVTPSSLVDRPQSRLS